MIVHGAWSGAWAWNRRVGPLLRAAGHQVNAVTLTGLGERIHLAAPEVDLETHVEDVVNVLFYEDLCDVVLVGHSYGGMVITGVADRAPERLRQLVYLDAVVPADGESLFDRMPPDVREAMLAQVRDGGDGWRLPPGPVPADQPPDLTAWGAPRRAALPFRAVQQPLTLARGETTLPRAFVYCAGGKPPDNPMARFVAGLKGDRRWRVFELATGHNLYFSAPEDTASILLELAARDSAGTRASR